MVCLAAGPQVLPVIHSVIHSASFQEWEFCGLLLNHLALSWDLY